MYEIYNCRPTMFTLHVLVLLQEQEAVALAKQLDDAGYALDKLLGPTMLPEGAPNRLKSDEVEQITEQLHTPDR